MSLPSPADQRHDIVQPYITRIIEFLRVERARGLRSITDPGWIQTLEDITRIWATVNELISRRELTSLPKDDMKTLVLPFDRYFFDKKISERARRLAFRWYKKVIDEQNDSAEDEKTEEMTLFGEENTREDDNYQDIGTNLGSTRTLRDGTTFLRLHAYYHKNAIAVFGTILHEMVHMYITHSWYCSGLAKLGIDPRSTSAFEKFDGKTGHGYYFQLLARAVEDRARQAFSFKIDLGRLKSMIVESRETDLSPSCEYLEEMFQGQAFQASPGFPVVPIATAAKLLIISGLAQRRRREGGYR